MPTAKAAAGSIFTLPSARILPFSSLWTMHVWIYWFNTVPKNVAELPWWANIYGAMVLFLLVAALACRVNRAEASAVRSDVPMTVLMCVCTAATFFLEPTAAACGGAAAAWAIVVIASAGVCMGWGYLRWASLFADMDIKDAVGCLFASYALGSTIKIALDAAPGAVGFFIALALPITSSLSLRAARQTRKDLPSLPARGDLLYANGSWGALKKVALCVFAFCFIRQVVSNGLVPSENPAVGRLLCHVVEVGFAVMALVWVFRLKRSLDFPQLWRFVFLFLGATIAAGCLELPPLLCVLSMNVTTSLIVMLLWLLLSDVAHHSDRRPSMVFGLGWSLYAGGNYLGLAATHMASMETLSMRLGIILLWVLGITMVFFLETRDPDIQRIFADLRTKVDPEEFATIDERCGQLAREYQLTDRELDVVRLLAKGRSKAYIAEALYISENTVRGHARRLYAKLGVHTRDELQEMLAL